jgi:hypothetical protein
MRPIGKLRWKRCCWSRAGNAGADCGAEGVEQKRTAVSGRWRALTSNWREVTSYDSRFYLDISVGFIFLSETAAAPFVQSDDRPNSIARLFQLPVLQGRLLRDAKTEAERCYRPLHLQKVQHDGAPVVGHPIQFYGLDGTARRNQVIGRNLIMHPRIAVMKALNRHGTKAPSEPRRKPAKVFRIVR